MNYTSSHKFGASPLDNDSLRRLAPSIFAVQPCQQMSAKYTFIPTIQVVEKMRQEGFQPFAAMQSRTRIDGKRDFTKHMIRFRHAEAVPINRLGGLYPEIVLVNAHDGGSAYRIEAGLFRMVCFNGMIVGEHAGSMRVRHSGSAAGIIEASYEIVEEFPNVLESAERFHQLRLTAPQQEAFAESALSLRYDEGQAPVQPAAILRVHRTEDSTPTLWSTFNVVQENMVNGGIRGRNPETQRRVRTRAVSGISENQRLNKALWSLTERMAQIMRGEAVGVAA
jgi:Domain of unknown function (DUF932)